jgi:hypothetical protein
MIGTGSTSTYRGTAITGTLAGHNGADVAAYRGTSIATPHLIRPSIQITRRRRIPPWKNPRRLDPATIGKFLIVGKCRGLFLRNCVMRFRGTPARARREAKLRPKARPARRWEPVVISPVFPRGPLALPSLGFLHDGLRPRRSGRERWAKRRRINPRAADQNLSRAACSSP